MVALNSLNETSSKITKTKRSIIGERISRNKCLKHFCAMMCSQCQCLSDKAYSNMVLSSQEAVSVKVHQRQRHSYPPFLHHDPPIMLLYHLSNSLFKYLKFAVIFSLNCCQLSLYRSSAMLLEENSEI